MRGLACFNIAIGDLYNNLVTTSGLQKCQVVGERRFIFGCGEGQQFLNAEFQKIDKPSGTSKMSFPKSNSHSFWDSIREMRAHEKEHKRSVTSRGESRESMGAHMRWKQRGMAAICTRVCLKLLMAWRQSVTGTENFE